ncbi:hypothetical protein [Agromyces humi]|uniref:hypothetical protein n=1 Tax=Agromyces humi TaxID=1766800 RepID=UPI00135B60D3|nr:hypothetical protein [Agromyces humi]
MTQPNGDYKPSKREMLRPVEYVGGAAIAAIFTGVITLVATREWNLALIATGGVFIVVLVALALFSMAVKPDAMESAEIHDADRAAGTSTDAAAPAPDSPDTDVDPDDDRGAPRGH